MENKRFLTAQYVMEITKHVKKSFDFSIGNIPKESK